MYPLTFNSLDNLPKIQLVTQMPDVRASKVSIIHGHSEKKFQESSFYLNGKSPHSTNLQAVSLKNQKHLQAVKWSDV